MRWYKKSSHHANYIVYQQKLQLQVNIVSISLTCLNKVVGHGKIVLPTWFTFGFFARSYALPLECGESFPILLIFPHFSEKLGNIFRFSLNVFNYDSYELPRVLKTFCHSFQNIIFTPHLTSIYSIPSGYLNLVFSPWSLMLRISCFSVTFSINCSNLSIK